MSIEIVTSATLAALKPAGDERTRAIPSAALGERGLSTARSVLRVLTLLAERPDGVRAVEIAQAVGKSVSTAYSLLESLCEEGYAVRDAKGGAFRLRRDPYRPEASAAENGYLAGAVDELQLRTRKRSYLARVWNGGIELVRVRGRQGMRKMPASDPGSRTPRMPSRWARSCSRCYPSTPASATSSGG